MEAKKLLEHRKTIKSRKPLFLRKDWHKISNLGLRRKNKQVWRKPKGRHNKMREKKKGHRKSPSIGYSSPRMIRGSVEGLMTVLVQNEKDFEKVGKNGIAILAKVGLKKKLALLKKAEELKIKVLVNKKKLLKKLDKKMAEKKTEEKTAEQPKKEEIKEEKN